MTNEHKNFPVFISQDGNVKNCGFAIKIELNDGYINQTANKRHVPSLESIQRLNNGKKIKTTKKRKRTVLSIQQKVEVLQKLDLGISIAKLREQYGIGQTTIYDLRTRKEQILKFYSESNSILGMVKRKTLRGPQNAALEKLLYEWFCQQCHESVHVTGPMLIERAKQLHNELKVSIDCEYSSGWLQKFRNRYNIRHSKNRGTTFSVSRHVFTPPTDNADFTQPNPCPNELADAENSVCSLKVTQVCSGKETEMILQKLAQDTQILEGMSCEQVEHRSSCKEESKDSLHDILISQESPQNFSDQENLSSIEGIQEYSTDNPGPHEASKSTHTYSQLLDNSSQEKAILYKDEKNKKHSEIMTVEEAVWALDSLIQFLEKQFWAGPQQIQLLYHLQGEIASKIGKEKI